MLGKTLSAAALALLTAAPTNATCTQANIAGSWSAYTMDTELPHHAFDWTECVLTINAAGKITAGSCTQSQGTTSPVTGSAHLAVPANCVFTAVIDFTKFKDIARITHATLSLDKQTLLGVGTDEGDKFEITMTKVE